MKLGEIINTYRKENNLSLRELASKCGLSHSYISSLEKGVDPRSDKNIIPTIDTLNKIAAALNMELNKLIEICGYINGDLLGISQKSTVRTEISFQDKVQSWERFTKKLSNAGLIEEGEEPPEELIDSMIQIIKLSTKIAKKKDT